MDTLLGKYITAFQGAVGITTNSYLTFLKPAVEEVSNAVDADAVLASYNKSLEEIAADKNFALNPDKTNDFAQLLGEAHFYLMCKNRGVSLERIKEGEEKTPDFRLERDNIHFEVKTLSVVSGAQGIRKSLEDSLDAQIDVEHQLKQGKTTAFGVTEIQPYGDKPYSDIIHTKHLSVVIDTLIEKTKQNIKDGQFPNKKSFLVLNLSIIPPYRNENYVLRPAYCDDHTFKTSVSGELWMMAFARPGAPVLTIPEFEGKPCVESIMKKFGILTDPELNIMAGILFMIHPWRRASEIWGLYDYDKYLSWEDCDQVIVETLQSITGNNWNDSKDSNGWQLHG